MKIKNITPDTIAVDVLGDYRELPSGWGFTEQEVGGKDVLLLIAFKLQGKVEIYDDNDQLMEFVHCPLCGNVTKVEPPKKVIQKTIEAPVEVKVEAEVKKTKRGRVKKSKK